MDADALNHFSLDELYSLLVKTVNEYLELHKKPDNKPMIESKRSELNAVQKMIADRKTEKTRVL